MKKLLVLLTIGLTLLPPPCTAAQTAQATFFSWSLRFQQGENTFGDSTLDLSTVSGTPNGELSPWFNLYDHRSNFVMDWMGFSITGTLYLDLPDFQDANGNGFDDSFEVSQGIGGGSVGEYTTVMGGGTITATWNRGAGSSAGLCSLRLVDDQFGDLGTFRHAFEVLEYTGTVAYTAGSNTVTGNVNLTNATDQLQGPVNFEKSVADPHDELTLKAGAWTNTAAQALIFTNADFLRDFAFWPTNYYGLVEFDSDENPATLEPYGSWELSIDDLNDADHDGIPDFSDDPAEIAPPRRPQLTLTRGPTALLFTVRGDVGRLHQIQETTSVASPNWQTVLSLTLTNDPQTVSIPLPASMTRFWRAVAQ